MNMHRIVRQARHAALAATALAVVAVPARAQQSSDSTFSWSGKIAPGAWAKVINLNGSVTVEHGTGPNVEITAVKRWRRSDPQSVRIQVVRYGSDDANVMVCALWGDRMNCGDNSYESHGTRNNDVSVAFTVRVPDGVNVGAATVNGGLRVTGATARVEASTVNGSVDVETSGGPVNAQTVNGSVRARMGKFPITQDMDFSTVNGSVVAEFAGDIDIDVDLSTVNGRFNTDYPVTVSGKLDPRNLRAKVGKGGPMVKMQTVNGNVELRRHD